MSTFTSSIGQVIACGSVIMTLSATTALAQTKQTWPGVFVWTTLPGKLSCAAPSQLYSVTHGVANNFAGDGSSQPTPNMAYFSSQGISLSSTTNTFDQTANDYHFGDTLPIAVPQGSTVTSMRLTTRLKPTDTQCSGGGGGGGGGPSGGNNNTGRTIGPPTGCGSAGPGASNDAINFHVWNASGATHTSPVSGFPIASISATGDWGLPDPAEIFTFDFMTAQPLLFNAVTVGAGLPPPLNLDVYIQDDTSVDFLTLELCYVPPKPIDLVAHKTRTKNSYTLSVTNAGAALPAGSVVQVLELVPSGLTMSVPPVSGPWACSPSGPVQGPDAVTCTMTVGAGGIATGGSLPSIQIPFKGQLTKCPNCMRVRLQSTPTGLTEANTANNVSCAN
jgi:hypothetical protein